MDYCVHACLEKELFDGLFGKAFQGMIICAAQRDPVTAIVRHASIRDVEGAIVDGVVRKLHGNLVHVMVDGVALVGDKSEPSWSIIASELAESRENIDARIAKLDTSAGAESMIQLHGIDKSNLVGWGDHIGNNGHQ